MTGYSEWHSCGKAEVYRSGKCKVFDVAVIGGGVVGCAVAQRFAVGGATTVLLERGSDILSGASKGNSGLLHTGFDAPEGSLELRCMRSGYAEYLALRKELNLPLIETGALVVAWTEADLLKLPGIVATAHRNGISDVHQINARDLSVREPRLSKRALGAVVVPGEHVIDPWSSPLAYAERAHAHGAQIRRQCEVTGGTFTGDRWELETTDQLVIARVVINCAGNYADLVEGINRQPSFAIRPRKGQLVVFDKAAHDLCTAIILPVPTAKSKGVLLARTAYGNLLIGPTAEEQEARNIATTDEAALRALIEFGRSVIPDLEGCFVTAAFAGLRPATQFKDYQIHAQPHRRWITVAGIRSTGLTASLGIAQYVAGLYVENFAPLGDAVAETQTAVPNLAEVNPRPYQQVGHGEIVCHCELVTAGEIEAALTRPLPARDLGGLRRRTRCMMGRCQGFYCQWRVMQLASPYFAENPVRPHAT